MAKGNKNCKLFEWQKRAWAGGVCLKCKNLFTTLTVDHIIPVYLLDSLGIVEGIEEDEENFEMLCKGCNRMKGARVDVFHPRTLPLLKKYVAMVEEKYSKVLLTKDKPNLV